MICGHSVMLVRTANAAAGLAATVFASSICTGPILVKAPSGRKSGRKQSQILDVVAFRVHDRRQLFASSRPPGIRSKPPPGPEKPPEK
jgi:hypothetical protein